MDELICAMKIFTPGEKIPMDIHRSRVEKEIMLLQKLQHPNIVTYLGHIVRAPCDYSLFMEYIPRTLWDQIKSIKDKKRNNFTYQEFVACSTGILKALSFMHSFPEIILHRDIKVCSFLHW